MVKNLNYNTKLLTDFMKERNLSKKQLAKLCDISVYSLNQIFNMKNVSAKVAYKICLVTKIKLDDLINLC
ncbi:MAG: transcriptional regulator [Candidatus Caccovivens sp.]